MPWSQVDCPVKGLTDKQKGKWASVANGVLKDLKIKGMDEKKAITRAIQIANSKFQSLVKFNPVIPPNVNFNLNFNGNSSGVPSAPTEVLDEEDESGDADISGVGEIESDKLWMTPDIKERIELKVKECVDLGGPEAECRVVAVSMAKRRLNFNDEVIGMEISEMEIFRSGTHNGDEFCDADLEEIASNFKVLKDDLRPKLKITHAEDSEQESLAGLASYGDVVDVFIKTDAEGKKRLYAKLSRVPKEVYEWIKEGRFAERSIEIYPEFKLGTKDDSPTYKNVLKSIALLGHQMPAVTGMAPIKLEECLECQGTSCFRENISEHKEDYSQKFRMFEKTLELEMKKIAV